MLTNNVTGYQVTVQADTTTMVGSAGNPDSIPIDLLGVRESGSQGAFVQLLDPLGPLSVHEQATPSGPGGDAISNDCLIQIPFVAPDTYTTTLDYIVTAN